MMVRPIGAFLVLFALLSLIVHQIGIFEFLAALASVLLTLDIMRARFSTTPRAPGSLRDPLL
jgi:hypothetical protein